MAPLRFANVSIDLDGIGCYHTIHRIDAPADPLAIYTVALPRFLDLFDEIGCRATLFVIASDTRHPEIADALRQAHAAGHEVASHTYHHDYGLRHRGGAAIRDEIRLAGDALEACVGARPVGFRTPGYNVDATILRVLADEGYRYDSSVFPSPTYYAAKAAVMGAMALAGRPSGSSMTHPHALRAPLQPYVPSRAAFGRSARGTAALPLWEVPVGVTPGLRLPVIGTTVCAVPPAAMGGLYRWFEAGQPSLQVELHGIDLMDATDAAVTPALAAKQPDVRRPWQQKRDSLASMLRLMARERTMLTLRDAVAQMPAPVA